jgi:hypothetical protein
VDVDGAPFPIGSFNPAATPSATVEIPVTQLPIDRSAGIHVAKTFAIGGMHAVTACRRTHNFISQSETLTPTDMGEVLGFEMRFWRQPLPSFE